MPASVDTVRDEVKKAKKRWDVVRDAVQGQDTVKERGPVYLPVPNATDTSPENVERYEAMKRRALFVEATARTKAGMVGQVFSRDPQVVLPPLLEPMMLNMDGRGSTAIQFGKRMVDEVIESGRGGLLADFPAKESGEDVTMAELQSGKFTPLLRFYRAEDIINWKEGVRNGVKFLRLVVLREITEEDDEGEFGIKHITRFRVLKSTGTQVTSRVYRQVTNGEWIIEGGEQSMIQGDGTPLDTIPFTFIGADDNTPSIGSVPLLGIARVCLSMYRNSADVEESSFLVGQPTLVLSGLTEEWVKDVLGGRVLMGSRSAIFLPENASASLIQAEENSLPLKLIEMKQKLLVSLGAKLVADRQVERTATESSIDAVADLSVLGSIVHNINAALAMVMPVALSFVDSVEPTPETLLFELNTDFDLARMDPGSRAQLVSEWQAGAIDYEELRFNLKRGGVAFKDDEDVVAAVAEEMDHRMEMQAKALAAADPQGGGDGK